MWWVGDYKSPWEKKRRKKAVNAYHCVELQARPTMFSRRSILPDTSASGVSQGNSRKQNDKSNTQDTLLNHTPAGWNKQLWPQWNVLRGMFIIKSSIWNNRKRIFLAVSCWMAACVCFWKTSLASHLHGSSTTSTLTSLPGESKFHISMWRVKKHTKNMATLPLTTRLLNLKQINAHLKINTFYNNLHYYFATICDLIL